MRQHELGGKYELICGEAAVSGRIAGCGTAIGRMESAGGLADGSGSGGGHGGGGVAHPWLGTGPRLVVARAAAGPAAAGAQRAGWAGGAAVGDGASLGY